MSTLTLSVLAVWASEFIIPSLPSAISFSWWENKLSAPVTDWSRVKGGGCTRVGSWSYRQLTHGGRPGTRKEEQVPRTSLMEDSWVIPLRLTDLFSFVSIICEMGRVGITLPIIMLFMLLMYVFHGIIWRVYVRCLAPRKFLINASCFYSHYSSCWFLLLPPTCSPFLSSLWLLMSWRWTPGADAYNTSALPLRCMPA